MRNALSVDALDQVFRSARTYQGRTDAPVDESMVGSLCDFFEMGAHLGQLQPSAVRLGSQHGGQGEPAELAFEKNRRLSRSLSALISISRSIADASAPQRRGDAECLRRSGRVRDDGDAQWKSPGRLSHHRGAGAGLDCV
jgi:hypothetical protein